MKRPTDAEIVKLLRTAAQINREAFKGLTPSLRESNETDNYVERFTEAANALEVASKPEITDRLRGWGLIDDAGRISRVFLLDDYRGETTGDQSRAAQKDARVQSAPGAKFRPLYSHELV